MADQNPGSIITPGGQPSNPAPEPPKPQEVPTPAPAPTSEVEVPIQQAAAPPAPEPTLAPQQPIQSQPAPQQTTQAPTPSTPAEQPPTSQPAASEPTVPPDPAPELQSSQGFATSGFIAPPEQAAPSYDMPGESFAQTQDSQTSDTQEISWTASEYITHQKSPLWYMALALGTALFLVPIYFITDGDIVSLVVIALVAVVFAVYAGRKPRELQYAINPAGISIGTKTYHYSQLKTFAIIDEGAFSSIVFLPMSRFMPAISIYYDPKDEDAIVTTLSNYLPMDTQKRDLVDNLMRKIRF